ncbi:hypothetical protein HZB01_04355 [Candidatus Woesearchaeota archaeon]|nr:hypothetical protein [Candidatus Woesearchaeota archaeon]
MKAYFLIFMVLALPLAVAEEPLATKDVVKSFYEAAAQTQAKAPIEQGFGGVSWVVWIALIIIFLAIAVYFLFGGGHSKHKIYTTKKTK